MPVTYPNPPAKTTFTIHQAKGENVYQIGRIEAPTADAAKAQAVRQFGEGTYYAVPYQGEPVFVAARLPYWGADARNW